MTPEELGRVVSQRRQAGPTIVVLPKWLAGFSGVYVDAHGYAQFFTATALLGLPVLVLVWLASRVHAKAAGV